MIALTMIYFHDRSCRQIIIRQRMQTRGKTLTTGRGASFRGTGEGATTPNSPKAGALGTPTPVPTWFVDRFAQ
jgi:hypothetical protein